MNVLLVIQAASTRAVPTCERTDFLWLPAPREEMLERLVHMLAVDDGLRAEHMRWCQDGYDGPLLDSGCNVWSLRFAHRLRSFDQICRAIEVSKDGMVADRMSYSNVTTACSVADILLRQTLARPCADAGGQGLSPHVSPKTVAVA